MLKPFSNYKYSRKVLYQITLYQTINFESNSINWKKINNKFLCKVQSTWINNRKIFGINKNKYNNLVNNKYRIVALTLLSKTRL